MCCQASIALRIKGWVAESFEGEISRWLAARAASPPSSFWGLPERRHPRPPLDLPSSAAGRRWPEAAGVLRGYYQGRGPRLVVTWSSRGQPSLGPPCAELQALPGGQSPLPGGLLLLQLSEQICRVLHDGGTKCALVVLDLFSDFINEFIHCLEMDSYGTKRFVDNFPGEAFNPNFADAVHGRCI